MALWQSNPTSVSTQGTTQARAHDPASHEAEQAARFDLTQARRRLVGAIVLLALACGLIPWMLDNKARSWGEDVVLKMPKSDAPYSPSTKPVLPIAVAPSTGQAPASAPANTVTPTVSTAPSSTNNSINNSANNNNTSISATVAPPVSPAVQPSNGVIRP